MSAAQDEFNELMRDKERRTRHPEDDEDGRSFLNLSDDDDDDGTVTRTASRIDQPRPSVTSTRGAISTIPSKRYGANTGPKGVISDAQDFRDSRRSQRESMRSTTSFSQSTYSVAHADQAPVEKLDEEDDCDDQDDSFMKKWRQNRLKEMQNGPKGSQMHQNGTRARMFGSLTMVDPDGYLDAVEKSDPHTVVVVYIYDDFSQVSDLCEKCIRTLAGKHQDTRFIKLHYEDAQMEPAGVPAIIAYKNGDKFAGLVPLIDEIPDDAELNSITLENLFKRHQILR